MPKAQFRQEIITVGDTASQVVQRNSTARVSGASSRGIYLQPGDDLILYLSREKFQGPLTLILADQVDFPGQLAPGILVVFQDGKIIFPDLSLQISLESARIWRPTVPTLAHHPRRDILEKTYQQVASLARERPFYPLLEIAQFGKPAPLPGLPGIDKRLGSVLETMQGEPGQLAKALIHLLGAGPGLTPLGDDLILGLLLSFNRGGEEIFPQKNLEEFNQIILGAAREKTTRLSFSLLTCAAQASADERLIQVLDCLLAGSDLTDQDLVQLLDWGSSSGMAVLAGMILALKKDPAS
jgi:hypothetical protein